MFSDCAASHVAMRSLLPLLLDSGIWAPVQVQLFVSHAELTISRLLLCEFCLSRGRDPVELQRVSFCVCVRFMFSSIEPTVGENLQDHISKAETLYNLLGFIIIY